MAQESITPVIDYQVQLNELINQLQTLNDNFTAYVTYETNRDVQNDEKNALPDETTVSSADSLKNIETLMNSVNTNIGTLAGNETVDYSEQLTSMTETQQNIEYNTSYQIGILGFIFVALCVIIGSDWGKAFLRKW